MEKDEQPENDGAKKPVLAEEKKPANAEKKPAEKKPAEKGSTSKPPAYFWVLLVVALIVAFALISRLSAPEQQLKLKDPGTDNTSQYLRIILITSSECRACDKEHSFMALLKKNNIPTELKSLDSNSEEGRQILKDFRITEVPVVLVGRPTISDKFLVKTNQGSLAKLEDVIKFYQKSNPGIVFTDNTIVIPEISFDSVPRTTFLTERPSCGSEKQSQVFVFTDPYCPTCIVGEALLNKFRSDFNSENSNVSVDYYFLPTVSSELDAKNNSSDGTLAVKYMQCAQTAESLGEFMKSFYTSYCGFIGKIEDNNPDYLTCGLANSHWMQPFTQTELDKRLDEAKVNRDVFNQCISKTDADIESNRALAVADNVDFTPLTVVDCRYKTPLENLSSTVCELHPNFPACKNPADSNSTAPAQ